MAMVCSASEAIPPASSEDARSTTRGNARGDMPRKSEVVRAARVRVAIPCPPAACPARPPVPSHARVRPILPMPIPVRSCEMVGSGVAAAPVASWYRPPDRQAGVEVGRGVVGVG